MKFCDTNLTRFFNGLKEAYIKNEDFIIDKNICMDLYNKLNLTEDMLDQEREFNDLRNDLSHFKAKSEMFEKKYEDLKDAVSEISKLTEEIEEAISDYV